MKCSICGVAGHNKRFHGGQHTNLERTDTRQDGQPTEDINPMDAIDPQVLEEHFVMADDLALAGDNQGGAETVAVEQRLTLEAPQSQVIDILVQSINISSTAINFGIRKNKLKVKRGGNANSQPVINMNQLPKEISGQNPSINVARHPSLKAQRKEKELDKG
ncbi:uncharacterized protein LOC120270959 isoform X2 [Dioscorea cayenensis subsp. rotundata]|uniref:Uncharacterized protein LOC120270959 isoform X2 n=1 Tax=Dioscorea cayennensis subsp. rotundata TaxID=55577 RepID=A0AB40C2W5_DIOCR|nr:uncharacterized protein LOC120270959 isoform X2 [Dioscorea cayenensis subsp. rotundata]